LALYGGGIAWKLARLFLEDHGNRFAFIGCNAKALAVCLLPHYPGAGPCGTTGWTAK
jgi:hypothetical protein